MNWEKCRWPYWLSGGTHASFVSLTIFVVAYYSGAIKIVPYTLRCLVAPCDEVFHVFFLGTGPFVKDPGTLALCALITLVTIFLIGAVLGFLYGRSVNRKKI